MEVRAAPRFQIFFHLVLAASQPMEGAVMVQIQQANLCVPPSSKIHEEVLNDSCQAQVFIKFANEQTDHDPMLPVILKNRRAKTR